jgi:hypothetical protein
MQRVERFHYFIVSTPALLRKTGPANNTTDATDRPESKAKKSAKRRSRTPVVTCTQESDDIVDLRCVSYTVNENEDCYSNSFKKSLSSALSQQKTFSLDMARVVLVCESDRQKLGIRASSTLGYESTKSTVEDSEIVKLMAKMKIALQASLGILRGIETGLGRRLVI